VDPPIAEEGFRGVQQARAGDLLLLRPGESVSHGAESTGEVLGLLGHNGAGKTTLLSQVVGLVRRTAGRITLLGRDPVADPAWARSVCSFQPQAQAPLTGVTTRQAIEIIGRIRAGSRRAAPAPFRARSADERMFG
jgi:ABC-type multidrug transport system ATPase subunit